MYSVQESVRPMEPASSSSVVDNILREIRNAISAGRFHSGDRLPSEFELMKELNVSRNSLREDVLYLAIRKSTQEDIQTLQEYINRMRQRFNDGKVSAAARLDYQFHQYLAHCTRNRFLERMVLGVYDLFERSIEQNIRTEEGFASADQHHQEMVDCILQRDTGRVEDVIARSLSSWRKDVKSKMEG